MLALGQFDASVYGKIGSVRSDFDTHESATTGVHGATSSATANRLVLRDGNGRARVTSPTSSSDDGTIATTGWARDTFALSDGVTSVSRGAGVTFSTNPIVETGTIGLSDTGVTPGSYTKTDITVDQQGRVTSASDGVLPTVDGLVSGTYTSADVTVNNKGVITDIQRGGRVPLLPSGASSVRAYVSYSMDMDPDVYESYSYYTVCLAIEGLIQSVASVTVPRPVPGGVSSSSFLRIGSWVSNTISSYSINHVHWLTVSYSHSSHALGFTYYRAVLRNRVPISTEQRHAGYFRVLGVWGGDY